MNFINWENKLFRSIAILFDKSEIFNDRNKFRFEIIQKIWNEI